MAEDLVSVVTFAGEPSPRAVEQAQADLARLPGVGAIVLDEGRSVVTWKHLLDKASAPQLDPLLALLASKSYAAVDERLDPWPAPAPARPTALQVLKRRARGALRVAPSRRAVTARIRWRRARFIARLRWEAWLHGTELDLQVSDDLYVEPGTRFHLDRGRATLHIGPRCRIYSGVLLRLRGAMLVGPGCEFRQDISLNVKGTLRFTGRNVLGKGAMIHADADMLWEWGACVADYVTVLDTHHDLDGTLVQMLDQGVTASPITMGASSFVGSKGSVMPGVSLGRASVVAAGSVVTRDVPDGAVVAGVPAKVIKQR
ncbi:MAG: transferase [Frankiales bacterium]|nr:transferase [Frankiales bacterium]